MAEDDRVLFDVVEVEEKIAEARREAKAEALLELAVELTGDELVCEVYQRMPQGVTARLHSTPLAVLAEILLQRVDRNRVKHEIESAVNDPLRQMDAWVKGLRIEWLWLRYALTTRRPRSVLYVGVSTPQNDLHRALLSTGRAIARGAR